MASDLSESVDEVLLATRSLDSDTWRSYQNNNDSTSRARSVSATLGTVTTDSDSKRRRGSLSSSNSSNSTNTHTVQIRKRISFDSAVVIMNTGGNTAGRNVQQHPDNAASLRINNLSSLRINYLTTEMPVKRLWLIKEWSSDCNT